MDLLIPTKELWVPDKSIHLPKPGHRGFYVEIGAWDKAHELLQQGRERSRSPVKQFMEILLCQMRQINVLNVVDTDGSPRNVYKDAGNLGAAPTSQFDYGIVTGTGSTAVDIEDYQLEAQVTMNWVHNTPVFDAAVTVADPDCTFEVYRNFNNNTGSQVVIAEVGIYGWGFDNTIMRRYMLFRDVPGASVTVPDGGGCYVKYTLKVTE